MQETKFEIAFDNTPDFGGIYMKNMIIRNLTKSMTAYGEMLNRVGC